MTWADFLAEFKHKYFNMKAMTSQQNEFNNLKQEGMSVTDAVRKFDQLARLCPHLVPTEGERVRRMLEMFRPELAVVIDIGDRSPETVAECVARALRAEYRLAQAKASEEEKAKIVKAQREERERNKSDSNQKAQGNHPAKNFNKSRNKNEYNSKRKWNQNANSNNNNQKKVNNKPYVVCPKCGKGHLGECKMESNACYKCGKAGHFAKD